MCCMMLNLIHYFREGSPSIFKKDKLASNDKGRDTSTIMKYVFQNMMLSQHYNPHQKYKICNKTPAFI